MQHITRAALACGVTLTANATQAQLVQTRQLGKAEAEFAEPFTQIAAVRELRDGRVLVVDPRDKVVQLVDLRSGAAVKIGREGQGPGEYSLPMSVIALPGDSSGIFDPLNQRYLLVAPDGKTGGFLSTRPEGEDREEQAQRRPGGGPMFRMGGMGMTPPRGTDRSGNIYVAGQPFRMGADGPAALDSAPLQRFNRTKKSYETIGYIKVPKPQVSGGANRMEVRIGGANPFAPRDDWAVAPDGRVAIVYASDYRVEWIAPNGQRTSGPATPYNKTKVTNAHKKWWQETARRRQTGLMVTNNNGRISATTAPAGPNFVPEERDDWPEYLPPFLNNAVQVAPNGQLWILQASASDDAVPTYDIFDGSGKLAARVQLAKRSRVVGFGSGTVYVIRSDEDDLQYLQRFRIQ